jgi:hypothetical protein
MTTAEKNAKISEMILARVATGETLAASMDAVLGAGTFERVAGEVYESLREGPAGEPAAEPEAVKFVPGVTYYTRSLGDHNCIWRFTVVRRTASSVWVTGDFDKAGTVERRKVAEYNGAETFSPFGRYSMSPSVYAHNIADGAKDRRDWEK